MNIMNDNQKALITVIVPVYNVEKYLDNCVNSLVNQTYKNLEIILVDDGSSDNSPQICDKWKQLDGRIKVIHKENGGASSARNAGLDAAVGDYIGFVDSDDYIDFDMYEIMLKQIMDNHADAASCAIVRENPDGSVEMWGSKQARLNILDNTSLLQLVGAAEGILPVSPCNKLFSKKVISDIRFDLRFKYAEDVLFNFQVSENIKTMVVQNVARYHYVSNETSVSHRSFDKHRFDEHKVMDIIFDMTKKKPEIYKYCVKGDVLKSFRTIKQMMSADNETDKFWTIRNRIIKNRKEIFKSDIYSKETKLKTLLLWLMPHVYMVIISKYGQNH